ncbi:MAG: hypothetical protein GF331_18935 [Chitinivibrionales bacterium]|nr:hypothetical protein [Chitinivibrionales bacterium]
MQSGATCGSLSVVAAQQPRTIARWHDTDVPVEHETRRRRISAMSRPEYYVQRQVTEADHNDTDATGGLPMRAHVYMRMFLLVVAVTVSVTLGQEPFFGSIWKRQVSAADADPLFGGFFDQVTPENVGKWGVAEPVEGAFKWDALDAMYEAADTLGMPAKHHTFVWGQQQPSWVTASNAQTAVENWISAYMARYGDRVTMIDVVNEPVHAKPSYRSGLGGDGSTGWDWVVWVYEKARQYAPNATLLVNEYDVLKSANVLTNYMNVIRVLNDRGLLDGIGVQGHFLEGTNATTIGRHLDSLATFGLPVYVSEYDVNRADDQSQLSVYQAQFPVMWEHPSVAGITLWGHREGSLWRDNAYLLRADGSERPALTWLRGYLGRPGPVRPTHLTAAPLSRTRTALTWRDNSLDEDGFVVERSRDGGAWTVMATMPADTAALVDSSLTTAGLYRWRVRAYRGADTTRPSLAAIIDTRGPVIIAQPSDGFTLAGEQGAVSITADGAGTVHYQWEVHDGTGWSTAGTDAPLLTLPSLSLNDHGDSVRCTLTDDNGTTLSDAATLRVYEPSSVYVEQGGTAVIEAEHYSRLEQNGDAVVWQQGSDATAGNGAYMTTPSAGTFPYESSCELSYPIMIEREGEYGIGVRRVSQSGQNSAAWGVDGKAVSTNDFTGNASTWTWQPSAHTVHLTPGLHVLHLRRRENRWQADRLVLTTGALPTGTVMGPGESAQGVEITGGLQGPHRAGQWSGSALRVRMPDGTVRALSVAGAHAVVRIFDLRGRLVAAPAVRDGVAAWRPCEAGGATGGYYVLSVDAQECVARHSFSLMR